MPRNYEFLHGSILGDNAGVLEARSFGAVNTGAIGLPTYRSKYFETFPSAWASAYAFSKLLKLERVSKTEALEAIGEWVSLFALHFLGIAHVEEYSRQEIVSESDPDFWPAIAGTFPDATQLESLILLLLDERTVLGAYYPESVFFPSRGRDGWSTHGRLGGFLDHGVLSWQKVSALLRGSVGRDFEIHLRSIATSCLAGSVQRTLLAFCDSEFKGSNVSNGDLVKLTPSPTGWRLPSAGGSGTQTSLLDRYPLRQPNREGGTTYYLLAGIDGGPGSWINASIGPHLPTPADFRRSGDRQIAVQLAGQTHLLPIGEYDRIVLVADLLLSETEPYWTRFPKNAADFSAKVRSFHKIQSKNAPGIFAGTQDDATVVCLAPLKAAFALEFPSVINDDDAIIASYDRATDKVRWTITVLGRQIPYDTSAVFCKPLADSSVAIWPSKVAPDWRIYAAKGTGFKLSYGRWLLVDETGVTSTHMIDLEQDEYVTVLAHADRPCQPRALLLTDANDRERGLLVLQPLPRAVANSERKPSLAIDFGTSNTCLASKNATGEPTTLTFDHPPVIVWGKKMVETPGYVPFTWGGKRGYYPSILLSLIRGTEPQPKPGDLRPEQLFTVDIPSLHDQLDGVFLRGTFTGTWAVHANLKWERDPDAPWRSYFLALSLLYAHAELFMRDGAIPSKYVFTFPLAFSDSKRQAFHEENRALVSKVRRFCFGDRNGTFDYVDSIDESRAIAKSAQATNISGVIEIFIDVGGGTADVAIRHDDRFLVLDSVRLAGRAFFHFTERNLRQQLLASDETMQQLVNFNLSALKERGLNLLNELNLDLGTAYSVSINGLDEATFKRKEGAILDTSVASGSYQRYRSQLFFRHLLTYGLLQACAAAADHKLPIAEGGINIICSGNAWGLLVFAHLHRSRQEIRTEAERILESIKDALIEVTTQEEAAIINKLKIFGVNLMNERDLRDAKTSVAIGALRAVAGAPRAAEDEGSTAPYTGVTLRNVIVNDAALGELRWCSRWAKREFAGRADADVISSFRFDASPAGVPIASILTLFSKLGNSSNRKADQLSAEKWGFVNGSIREAYVQRRDLDRSPLNYFVSDVLYPDDAEHVILDELARLNRSFSA